MQRRDAITIAASDTEVEASIRWVSGPNRVSLGEDDFVVLSIMRNAMFWVKSFFEHYSRLGARHFFIVDNGSTDGTRELLARRPDVTVLRSDLQFEGNENGIHRHLLRTYGSRCWSLLVDQDEHFDYPGATLLPMPKLLRYLRANGHNALRCHMIDRFSDVPLRELRSRVDDDLSSKYPFADLSGFWAIRDPHGASNRGPGRDYPFLIGGIRGLVFGLQSLYLTKHPLLFDGGRLGFPDNHCIVGAQIADVSGVLWHYKFLEVFYASALDFLERWKFELNTPSLQAIHGELLAYTSAIQQNPELTLARQTAILAPSCDALVGAGILHASESYRVHCLSGESGRVDQANVLEPR